LRLLTCAAGDDDDGGLGAAEGAEAHGTGSAGEDEADVSVGEVIGPAGGEDGLGHLLRGNGYVEEDAAGGVVESADMFLEAEDAAVVEADAFEDAVAVEETVIED